MKNRSSALELPDDIEQWLDIHPDVAPVEITLAVQEWGPSKEDHEIAKEWVKKVRALYYAGGKPSEKVVVGLVADTGVNYKNGEESRNWSELFGKKKGTKLGIPIRLLQICVGGGHVLFFYCYTGYDEKLPRCLVDLLIDTKTIVAAVGMKKLEERLDKFFSLTLPRSTDLSRLAAYYDHCFVKPDGYDNISVMKLADQVYRDGSNMFDHNEIWEELSGGERTMVWWEREYWWYRPTEERSKLSDEKIQTGALEAYLVHEMARKLLSRSSRVRLIRK